jgi:hypothetical protein
MCVIQIFLLQFLHSVIINFPRLSGLRADRPLPPGRFLVLISVKGCVDPRAIVRLTGFRKLKKNGLIGTRTRDHLACGILPQPNTLPSAPYCDVRNVFT